MMTMVVPKLLEIFDDKSKLPESTQILIAVSDFMVNYWYLIIGFFIAVFI
jgi:type II secretory pathway component PulF